MKKIILSAAAVFAFGFANAQDATTTTTTGFGFAQGDIFVEGQLNFSSNNETATFDGEDLNEEKQSSFNFSPKVGFFVSDKFAVGLQVNIGSGKSETTDFTTDPNVVVEESSSSFGAGAFARYYFLNLGERFKTYTELGVGFGSTKNEVGSTETGKDTNLNIGIDLGINYFVTPNMAISFGLADILSFNSVKSEDASGDFETTRSEFNGNINSFNNFFNTPTFGLLYKF
ncbi:MAG TPA: OmpA family protein [Flavobacterium sp.]|jgi:outer membrane protein